MTVKVTPVKIGSQQGVEVSTTIYTVEVGDNKASWCETFNTDREVTAFLRGLRCRSMMPDGLLQAHPASFIPLLP